MKLLRFGRWSGARPSTSEAWPLAGQFQRYNHTLPDRYPWIFDFASNELAAVAPCNVLSFGCSLGDETLALQRRVPHASITGIDVDPQNIEQARSRALRQGFRDIRFVVAADTTAETSESLDAIFCLAVLCLGDLTTRGLDTCEPYISFARFEDIVTDFSRCLKPGGLLFLHTTNFCFSDTQVYADFDVVLEASLENLAQDVIFDRNNRLMPGLRYREVGFRRRYPEPPAR